MILLQKSDMDRNSLLTIFAENLRTSYPGDSLYCAHEAIDAMSKCRFGVLSYPRATSQHGRVRCGAVARRAR